MQQVLFVLGAAFFVTGIAVGIGGFGFSTADTKATRPSDSTPTTSEDVGARDGGEATRTQSGSDSDESADEQSGGERTEGDEENEGDGEEAGEKEGSEEKKNGEDENEGESRGKGKSDEDSDRNRGVGNG